MNEKLIMQNERMCGLYIDMLMIVRYSHEAWGWVVSVQFMANRHSRVCMEKTLQSNGILSLSQNDSVLTPKSEFKLAPNPNPAWLGAGRQRRAGVCGEPSMS